MSLVFGIQSVCLFVIPEGFYRGSKLKATGFQLEACWNDRSYIMLNRTTNDFTNAPAE